MNAVRLLMKFAFVCLLTMLQIRCVIPPESESRNIHQQASFRSFLEPGLEQPILSLDELPADVREKLDLYLLNRMGADYRERLVFSRGQFVDIGQLSKIQPEGVLQKFNPCSYQLIYGFHAPEAGIDLYETRMEMDSLGVVTQHIGYPHTARFPHKQNLIHWRKAWKYPGVPIRGFSNVSISYDRNIDALCWVYHSRGLRTVINAHTGEFVDRYTRIPNFNYYHH